MKLFITTLIALIAFAGNSVVCRLALAEGSIDANTFTIVRLISGASALLIFAVLFKNGNTLKASLTKSKLKTIEPWLSAFLLWLYAITFSFAYIELGAAAGALILFASVQITLAIKHKLNGQPTLGSDITGLLLAFSGLLYWLGPQSSGPSMLGSAIMMIGGIAWAGYTYMGMVNTLPAKTSTTRNFILSVPLALLSLVFFYWVEPVFSSTGVLLAIFSGVVTSALGYWLWYQVLPHFSGLIAGVLQLSVPIIAALGGIVVNQEPITLSFIIASSLILVGIFFMLKSQANQAKSN
ncbi:DMT family transporter [Bermanella marisrubri]|uniref:Membrane protein n=1 Tax=Bermanella marisrubri TaxID=207949 RepID=Q1N638_9GAMM|nr:DMT family transporter [Bermanella marisrubri]EAT13754.1 membrane protein [Oceanobacter sp. RED65] [Bermanella marisrubri]QIZ84528.1 DMT family transporter [Bermanella marisrubri]